MFLRYIPHTARHVCKSRYKDISRVSLREAVKVKAKMWIRWLVQREQKWKQNSLSNLIQLTKHSPVVLELTIILHWEQYLLKEVVASIPERKLTQRSKTPLLDLAQLECVIHANRRWELSPVLAVLMRACFFFKLGIFGNGNVKKLSCALPAYVSASVPAKWSSSMARKDKPKERLCSASETSATWSWTEQNQKHNRGTKNPCI